MDHPLQGTDSILFLFSLSSFPCMYDFPLYQVQQFSNCGILLLFSCEGRRDSSRRVGNCFQCKSISLGFSTLSACLSVLVERRFTGSRSNNQIDPRKRVGGLEREGLDGRGFRGGGIRGDRD